MPKTVTTHFAPPERAGRNEIERQYRRLGSDRLLMSLLDCFPEAAVVLNAQRQIVFANDKLCKLLGKSREDLLGLRPGEALACVHAYEEDGGCGTSRFCRLCGAAQAIVSSQADRKAAIEECRITRRCAGGTESLDLRVWATPVMIMDDDFTVFAVRDTTAERRREVLERMFFHDVLNTAGGLRGILDIWPEVTGAEAVAIGEQARWLAEDVVAEIEAQRDLAAAERGDLKVDLRRFDVGPLLVRLCLLYSRQQAAEGKTIAAPEIHGPTMIQSDDLLLGRILGNLIKNALEASQAGQAVRIIFVNMGAPTFHVHNETAMPEDVQLQVFQRSFSTKEGKGRGIGTYSIKLLTERYLKGWVTFNSSVERGTTFTLTLPGSGA